MKQKSLFFFLLVLIICGCSTAPQQDRKPISLPDNVQLAGTTNAIVRIDPNHRYLLLPVQESAPEDYVRVIANNRETDAFTIRLAVDSIDYYVPYLLSPDTAAVQLLFDVRLGKSDVEHDQYVCWSAIVQSDSFDTANREPLRPAYHHTPLYGWMNDPNGMFYDAQTGLWHLYFQYNPYGSMWQNMTWGHSVSRDLTHWQQVENAIMPDANGMIFSGSCVVDDANDAGFGEGAIVAFYTSARDAQSQSMAYSLDGGMTFTPYCNNPILTDSIADFRDPKVFRNEQAQCWTMILACGQEVRFYNSTDLKKWSLSSSFGSGYGNHSGVWECPDLLQLPVSNSDQSKWVLIVNINPGGPYGGSATQYFVGDFDGSRFVCLDQPSEQKWLDYGKDHYATVTFHASPDNRAVALAWVSNWQYANQVPTVQFRSQNSLPRDLSLYVDDSGEYRVAVLPSPETAALCGNPTDQLTETAIIDIRCPKTQSKATITLSNSKGEKVLMTYNFAKRQFTMDRHHSGQTAFSRDFAAATSAPLFVDKESYRLMLYLDNCIIEAFDADGDWAMTNLVFPTEPYNQLTVDGGEATIYQVNN